MHQLSQQLLLARYLCLERCAFGCRLLRSRHWTHVHTHAYCCDCFSSRLRVCGMECLARFCAVRCFGSQHEPETPEPTVLDHPNLGPRHLSRGRSQPTAHHRPSSCPTIKLVVVVCPGRVSSGLRDAHTALTHPLELHAAAKRLPLLLPIIVHLSWDQACGVSSMLRGQRSSRAFNGHVGTDMGIHVHGLDPASAHHMEGSFVLPVVTSSFDCRQHTGVPYTLFRPERTEPTANICHLWGLFSRPLLLFSCPLRLSCLL